MKKTGIIIGFLFILCGVVPLFYRVFNIGSVFLLLIGFFILFMVRFGNKMPRALHIISVVCLCAGFLISATVSAFMAWQAWGNTPPDGENLPVIVLGGRVYDYGPSLIVAYRLDAAAAYLQENPQTVCVVSGGQGTDEPKPEAEVMAEYLVSKHGISSDRIILEAQSANTQENIRYSKVLLNGETSVVIVTDSFHQLRASMLAKAEGITAYSVPSFTPPGLFPTYWVRDMLGVLYVLVFA